jgi:hypothetical protein
MIFPSRYFMTMECLQEKVFFVCMYNYSIGIKRLTNRYFIMVFVL